jgi:hypothetical protein
MYVYISTLFFILHSNSSIQCIEMKNDGGSGRMVERQQGGGGRGKGVSKREDKAW